MKGYAMMWIYGAKLAVLELFLFFGPYLRWDSSKIGLGVFLGVNLFYVAFFWAVFKFDTTTRDSGGKM